MVFGPGSKDHKSILPEGLLSNLEYMLGNPNNWWGPQILGGLAGQPAFPSQKKGAL